MIGKINHIAVAVNNLEEALKLYTEVLGLEVKEIEVVENQRVKVAVIPVGERKIELVESTDPEGPIARHIERKGEGLHHLALEVSDIQAALETVSKRGIQLIDEKPRIGAGGHKIAFLHPRGTKILIELIEPRKQ